MAEPTSGNSSVGSGPGSGNGAAPAGDDIAAIFNFDPFARPPGEEGETPPPDGTPAPSDAPAPADKKGAAAPGKESPASAPKPGAAPAAKPAAPAPATPKQEAPDFQKLFREQTEAIKSLVTPAAAPKAPDATPAPPKFNVGIPPQLLEGLNSEDMQERAVATHALVNGIANLVWNEVTTHLKTELGTLASGIPQMMEAHAAQRQTQQAIFQDFYSSHQNLAGPQFQPLVLSAAQAVFQDYLGAGRQVSWDAEMRDAIAEKIYSAIPQLRPVAGAAPPKPGQPAAPAQRRFMPGGSSRPAAAPAGPENEMLAVLAAR